MTADDWSHEETDDPRYADPAQLLQGRKVEQDGQRVEELLFADMA